MEQRHRSAINVLTDSVDFFFYHNVLLYLIDMAGFLKSRLIAPERYKGSQHNGHESAVHLVMHQNTEWVLIMQLL